jgi:predicted negative regulator of RcsB-dependent stress response
MKLAPDDFPLASDVAQTYYGIKPMRTNDALRAWTNALNVAHSEVEREGTHIHLARTKMMAGRYDEALAHLSLVVNENFADLKARVLNAVQRRMAEDKQTNTPPKQGSVAP